jgi:adenylate cyclase
MATSAEFSELQRIHEQLIGAMRSRSRPRRELVNAAKLKAPALCGGLSDFYRRIGRRTDHFAGEPLPFADEVGSAE